MKMGLGGHLMLFWKLLFLVYQQFLEFMELGNHPIICVEYIYICCNLILDGLKWVVT